VSGRPTAEDLAHAEGDLQELAWRHDPRTARNSTGFPDVATLLNLLVWVDDEIKAAREAAAYGPGVKDGYHTLPHGNVSDLDARTRDQLLKELRNLRSGWLVELGSLVDGWKQAAYNAARFPTRSEQAG
jgi:hypothetical protein